MKKWYLSKTLWINIIAIIGFAIQQFTGKEVITPELQLQILALINLILRLITKEQIVK